jgi:hypothetical protein
MGTQNRFKKGLVKFKDLYEYVKSYVAKYLELQYKGSWNASTNTPTLVDGVGNNGDFYKVSVAGSQDLGSGSIDFTLGDEVRYSETLGVWQKFDTGVSYVPVNKAGDTMTGNLSVPKISVGTTNTPSIDTVGEGLTAGPSLAGVTQTARRTTSRIGNAELNFHNHHLHSATSWIKNLFVRSKGDTDTHVSVASGDVIEESIYGGRYQSGGTGAYYPAVSIKKKIGTGTVSNTSMPGELSIEVSQDGAVVPVEAFKIASNKNATFFGNAYFTSNTESLSGTKTLIATSAQYQFLNPNGANRDVTLPSPATNMLFIIKNTGSSGNTLVVKDSGGSAITGGTIANTVTMAFYYNGSSWQLV